MAKWVGSDQQAAKAGGCGFQESSLQGWRETQVAESLLLPLTPSWNAEVMTGAAAVNLWS